VDCATSVPDAGRVGIGRRRGSAPPAGGHGDDRAVDTAAGDAGL